MRTRKQAIIVTSLQTTDLEVQFFQSMWSFW